MATAARPLEAVLEVEAAALREEVGVEVETELDLPTSVPTGAGLAAVRVAQELLALAARRAEVTTLRVGPDGGDLVVRVDARDDSGAPMAPVTLDVPPGSLEVDGDTVRIRHALADGG